MLAAVNLSLTHTTFVLLCVWCVCVVCVWYVWVSCVCVCVWMCVCVDVCVVCVSGMCVCVCVWCVDSSNDGAGSSVTSDVQTALMYVCPCIIYEHDERYQLEATIYLVL